MARLNPGISAAGREAGRTAQNPSVGPAAIGGMLSASTEELPPIETPEPSAPGVRLTLVVSEIARLADAMEALVVRMPAPASPAPNEPTAARTGIGRHGRHGEDVWGGAASHTHRTPERVTADSSQAERSGAVQTMEPEPGHWRRFHLDSA